MNKEPVKSDDDGDIKTFDMYHFFSRFDVIAIALIIVGLLIYNVYMWAFASLPPA